jgi:cysteinyl-tRNA synthetase
LGLRIAAVVLPAQTANALRSLLEELRAADPALFPAGGGTGPDDVVTILLDGRNRARQARRFDIADTIRRRLGDLGIIVEDLPGGSRWRVAARRDPGS